MTRTLVVSPEPVRARMAGMGIRALQVARTLERAGHDVTLAAPAPASADGSGSAFDAGVRLVPVTEVPAVRAEVAIVSGHAAVVLGSRFSGCLVADLYDPFAVENLAYATTLGPAVHEHDRAALSALLSRADLILVATEEQRLFTLGTLLALGRLPGALLGDPEGRRRVAVAPFGIDEATPGEPSPHPSLGPGPRDVLFGGVYDWYDPDLVLDAWPVVLDAVPDARLVFVESPNPSSTPQVRLETARRRSEEAGWLGRSVHVVPWLAYTERGGFYRACRAAVLTHRPSLEGELSFRTRALDFLWAGLPTVATAGGAASRLIGESGAGLVVPGRADAVSGALVRLLADDEAHAAAAARARQAAGRFLWSRTLGPLLAYVRTPDRWPAATRSSPLARARRAVGRAGRALRGGR